jgi:hypothetical protein
MQIVIVQHAVHQGQYWNMSGNVGVFSAHNVKSGKLTIQLDTPKLNCWTW